MHVCGKYSQYWNSTGKVTGQSENQPIISSSPHTARGSALVQLEGKWKSFPLFWGEEFEAKPTIDVSSHGTLKNKSPDWIPLK